MAQNRRSGKEELAGDSSLSELDWKIIRRLKDEPRCTNKSLAEALSVNEATIAARIRNLESSKTMKVMAQRDMRAAGYNILALVDVFTSGRSADAVADDIAKLHCIGGVSVQMDEPAVIAHVNAATLQDLEHALLNEIGRIKGVVNISASLVVDVVKYDSAYGGLK